VASPPFRWGIAATGGIAQQFARALAQVEAATTVAVASRTRERAEEFGTPPAPLRCDHAALYAGWYTLNHYNDAFTWNPGAIGIHLDSASATNPRAGTNWAANALARGITITAGAVTEPYLENLPHPDQALWYLFHGANVGDALLRSERLLKWRILNIGDPLYRPFPKAADLAEHLKPPIVFALLSKTMPGNTTSLAVIALSKAASEGPLNFSVRSDRPDLVSIPPSVTVPEGAYGVKFAIKTLNVSAETTTVRLYVTTKDLQRSNTLVLFSPLESLNLSLRRSTEIHSRSEPRFFEERQPRARP